MLNHRLKKSKYANEKIIHDGIKFDSKKEGKRYLQLKEYERIGVISHLRLQVRYDLAPSQYVTGFNGKQVCVRREIRYIADFVYILEGKEVVEDCKGFKTAEYKHKKILMEKIHGIIIKES